MWSVSLYVSIKLSNMVACTRVPCWNVNLVKNLIMNNNYEDIFKFVSCNFEYGFVHVAIMLT